MLRKKVLKSMKGSGIFVKPIVNILRIDFITGLSIKDI